MKLLYILLILLSISIFSSLAKPVFGPIGVAEKHKIAKMLESEQRSLQELEEEQTLLERVVETLSDEIEVKEEHIRQLRSYTHGKNAIVGNINDHFYNSNYKNAAASRPGR